MQRTLIASTCKKARTTCRADLRSYAKSSLDPSQDAWRLVKGDQVIGLRFEAYLAWRACYWGVRRSVSLRRRVYAMNFFQAAQPSLIDRAWMVVRYPYNLVKNPFEALLSIPALSFLIIPTFSSYSTSLNLLFFYLTWSTLILSNSPLKVELFGTLAIRMLFYILPSLSFLAFDIGAPKVAIGIKEHGESALPLSDEPEGKKQRWWKIVLVSVGNVLLGVALQAGIELLFTQILHMRSALKVTTSIPMPWSIAVDLVKGLLLREARRTLIS